MWTPRGVSGREYMDQSRKRSSTGAKREQSESRKHLSPGRDAKEDDMVEEDLEPIKAKFEKLKLERENRMVERKGIP